MSIKSFCDLFAGKASVGVVGATGRLGQQVVRQLNQKGVPHVALARDVFQKSLPEMREKLEARNIGVVLNCSGTSKGTLKEMMKTNKDGPLRLAYAAQQKEIPFIHTSTTATQIQGLSPNEPYAYSKAEAEKTLLTMPNVKVARLDALVGHAQAHTIDIGYLAGNSYIPISVHLKGQHQIFQPTSYDAVGKALSKMAEACLDPSKGSDIPSVVNMAGAPIAVSDFTRMMNPRAIELHTKTDDLMPLAEMIKNGSFTPEFLRLANLSSQNPVILDNSDFKILLGEDLPTPEELAQLGKVSLLKMLKTYHEILQNAPDKKALILEALKVIQKAEFMKPA